MTTLYSNLKAGQITDAPLTSGATTINSAAFEFLPEVVSPDILWITLDPDAASGAPEIVKVTAHTASATSVTVVRAQQSTTAREHAVNTVWRHAVTKEDLDAFLVEVTTADINDVAVTTAKLADDSVTAAKLDSTAWTSVVFENSWTDLGTPWQTVGYYRIGDRVYVEGICTGGVVGATTPIFTLPVGLRPADGTSRRVFTCSSDGALALVYVYEDGSVCQASGLNTSLSLQFDFSVTA